MKQHANLVMFKADQYARKVIYESRINICESNNCKGISAEDFEQKRIQLIIDYIFPQLKEHERMLLACLYWHHALFEKLCKMNPPQDLDRSITYERFMIKIEQNYMEYISNTIKSINIDQLSPLQRSVIEEKFINIDFNLK